MASRKTRAQIAQQTVDILNRGWYTLPDGTTISLGDSVREAVQRTRHYAPADFADVFAGRDQILAERQDSGLARFDVVNATTLSAARKLVDSRPPGDVVCLNFASPRGLPRGQAAFGRYVGPAFHTPARRPARRQS